MKFFISAYASLLLGLTAPAVVVAEDNLSLRKGNKGVERYAQESQDCSFCTREQVGCTGNSCAIQCPAGYPAGYYPDLTDCKAYCYCTGTTAPSRYEQCQHGLVWDPLGWNAPVGWNGVANAFSYQNPYGQGHMWRSTGGVCNYANYINDDRACAAGAPWVATDTCSSDDSGDLDMRYSKFQFLSGVQTFTLPLQPSDYPMEDPLAADLRYTNAASVMTSDDPTLAGVDVEDYIERIGGAPTYPDADPNHPFWQDFREVVDAQVLRVDNNAIASDFVLPDLWTALGMDAYDVAEAVHDEYPGFWQAELIKSLVSQGVAADPNIFQFRSVNDFIGSIIRYAKLNTWATGVVAQINFRVKWYFGRPRPEEVAYAIYDGTIPSSAVPTDIFNTIQSLTLGDATDFTAYDEGSPPHPSFPAMHSAASSASFWMSVVMDLTPAQYCQALRTDYAVSFARTVAGVHYPTDNIAGLNLGQEILADRLVDHLVDRYSANRSAAQRKVNAMRFDWANFNPVTCRTS